ncbi:MAG: uracil-DNA glycosylase [Candidatus Melainabacteria bacterium]|nr:uracil-DNA glycosylase [Candidatus Melainabacteria bacterium]
MTTTIDTVAEKLSSDWAAELKTEFKQDYMRSLKSFLDQEVSDHIIYPPADDTFNAFKYCPLSQVKVVILGQDPYHGPGQAHGLCFSVREGIAKPPSLVNIFKELNGDLGLEIPNHGDLSAWAKQGVFLLNTSLSVRAHQAGSHFGQGWETFTDKVIETINKKSENVVFMLWGAPARKKALMIDKGKHLVLEAPHPSPLSAHRGFLGCKHFSQANEYLESKGKQAIDWVL